MMKLRNLARTIFLRMTTQRSVFNIMRILALKDDRNAQLDLGRFYFGGDGVEQNYEKPIGGLVKQQKKEVSMR